jgi:chromosome segregation ATPase
MYHFMAFIYSKLTPSFRRLDMDVGAELTKALNSLSDAACAHSRGLVEPQFVQLVLNFRNALDTYKDTRQSRFDQALTAKDKQLRQALATEAQLRQALTAKDEQLRQALAAKDEQLRQALAAEEQLRRDLAAKDNVTGQLRQDLAVKEEAVRHLVNSLESAKETNYQQLCREIAGVGNESELVERRTSYARKLPGIK